MSRSKLPKGLALACVILLGLFLSGDFSRGGKPDRQQQLKKEVQEIADAWRKKDLKAVDQKAKAIANREGEIYYLELLLKPRAKKGFGVGPMPNTILPDGIEHKLQSLTRDPLSKAKLKAEAADLEEMGYRLAAIARISHHSPDGKRNGQVWSLLTQYVEEDSLDFIEAVKAGQPETVKTVATRLNHNCTVCHSQFSFAPLPLPVRPEKKPPAGKKNN